MAEVAIIGPGCVGGVMAATLQRAGHDVTVCARRALGEVVVGLTTGDVKLTAPVLMDPTQGRVVDWVLVTTKAYDAAGAAQWFPKLVGPRTRVAVLQNGVEHRERFARWLPAEKILPVMVDCPAERPSAARVVQRARGKMLVPQGRDGAGFVQLFPGDGPEVTETADFTTAIWKKLSLNSPGAINALLLQPTGVFHDEAIGRLALEMIRETMAVGTAEGAVIEDAYAEQLLAGFRAAPRDGINSLHADRAAGKPMEVDARNGAVVRFGKKHGIATPRNAMAVDLLNAMMTSWA